MIPQAYIIEWFEFAPWPEPRQIEQDLIITTALIKLYNDPILQQALAFRGGTALNKLVFKPALRYSEDIDLVQIAAAPIGSLIDQIQTVMNPWLGIPKRDFAKGCITLDYRITSEDNFPLRLKFEINGREHFSVMGIKEVSFFSTSRWQPGSALIRTYHTEELLGTKLRALYQRRKGRDLFDLYMALTSIPNLNLEAIITCFKGYLAQEQLQVSRKNFIDSMDVKILNNAFRNDITPLLSMRSQPFDPDVAYQLVRTELIDRL